MKNFLKDLKGFWPVIAFVILAALLAIALTTQKQKTGNSLLDRLAHGVGELAGEVSEGFNERKKK